MALFLEALPRYRGRLGAIVHEGEDRECERGI